MLLIIVAPLIFSLGIGGCGSKWIFFTGRQLAIIIPEIKEIIG